MIVTKSQVLKGSSVGPKLVRHQNMRATMPLHRFSEEFQRGFSIPALGHKGFQDFSFVINGSPKVMGDAIDLHEDLVQMPTPVGQGPHSLHPFAPDLGGKHWAKAVPPEPHGFMADLDAPLMQEVLDVAQRERVADIEHHRQADDLGAGLEVAEGGALDHLTRLGGKVSPLKEFAMTTPRGTIKFMGPQAETLDRLLGRTEAELGAAQNRRGWSLLSVLRAAYQTWAFDPN